MTNSIADHPTTRAKVLDRLRGLRRCARKLRDKLHGAGPIDNSQRHELYGHAEQLVLITDATIRLLDAVRPNNSRRRDERETKGAGVRPVRRQHQA